MDEVNAPHCVTDVRSSRKPGVYIVSFDADKVMVCPDDVVARWHLQRGQHLSETQMQELTTDAENTLARRVAIEILAQGPLTSKQMDQRLRRRGFSQEARSNALARMNELGYLDDAGYARSLADALTRRQNLGSRRIREELLRRGINREMANTVLPVVDNTSEREKALVLAKKRWRPDASTDQAAAARRLAAYLFRRGFDWSVIRWCLEQVMPDVDTDID